MHECARMCVTRSVYVRVWGGAGLTEVSRGLVQNQVQKVREPGGQITQK